MQKQEFLKLFETAIRAAKSSARGERNSPEVARCVDAMNCLKEAPESLACDVILTTSIGQNLRVCIDHINPRIQSEANNLRNLWLSYLYATCRTKRRMISNGDSTRDKVIEILQTSLSKVANEVVETEMKKRVIACDPRIVAVNLPCLRY